MAGQSPQDKDTGSLMLPPMVKTTHKGKGKKMTTTPVANDVYSERILPNRNVKVAQELAKRMHATLKAVDGIPLRRLSTNQKEEIRLTAQYLFLFHGLLDRAEARLRFKQSLEQEKNELVEKLTAGHIVAVGLAN